MAVSVEIAREYGYVVLVVVLHYFLNFWMAIQVRKAREKYKVFYPNLYAIESENKDAKLFNCVQRGHQNSLESMPVFFVTLLVGGFQYPVIAAGLGVLYTVARFFYFKGYSTGVPKNRLKIGCIVLPPFSPPSLSFDFDRLVFAFRGLNFAALFGLVICTASFGIHLLIREVL